MLQLYSHDNGDLELKSAVSISLTYRPIIEMFLDRRKLT